MSDGTPASTTTTTESDEYVRFKKDQILDAIRVGNMNKAQRHATELVQYLGHGSNEMPIDDMVNE